MNRVVLKLRDCVRAEIVDLSANKINPADQNQTFNYLTRASLRYNKKNVGLFLRRIKPANRKNSL